MRVTIAGPVKVRAGQRASFNVSLRKDMTYAFCTVYSSIGNTEPSPHVDEHKLGILIKGKPIFANPTAVRLSETKREDRLEITPTETGKFYIMQEIDVKGDRLARGRIKTHGKIKAIVEAARGWFRRR